MASTSLDLIIGKNIDFQIQFDTRNSYLEIMSFAKTLLRTTKLILLILQLIAIIIAMICSRIVIFLYDSLSGYPNCMTNRIEF
jgi:hypothetical protein